MRMQQNILLCLMMLPSHQMLGMLRLSSRPCLSRRAGSLLLLHYYYYYYLLFPSSLDARAAGIGSLMCLIWAVSCCCIRCLASCEPSQLLSLSHYLSLCLLSLSHSLSPDVTVALKWCSGPSQDTGALVRTVCLPVSRVDDRSDISCHFMPAQVVCATHLVGWHGGFGPL
jgi:hypothetical protein